MRRFRYNEPTDDGGNEVIETTEEEILAEYFPYWSSLMQKKNLPDITPEHCLDDFCVVHWAWEVKD